MSQSLEISPLMLVLAFSLVLITMFISYKEKLDLIKEILIASIRVVIQLFIVGYFLTQIFEINNTFATLAMVAVIIFNAAWNTSKRGAGINRAFTISLIAISLATMVTLSILVFSGSLKFIPSQIIPITGMICGSAMTAIGLTYRNLKQLFQDRRQTVLEMLALGASPKQASSKIKQLAVKSGIQPTIDSIKTTGLVTLPGMMSGLMFAGVDPTKAIMYQIMISFMMIGTTSLVAATASSLSIGSFFNDRYQLISIKED